MRRLIVLILTAALLGACPCQASPSPKYAALTFDDGPSGRFTQRLLDGLQARDVHATFFLCGYRLEDFADLAEQIHRQGHEIGLHGYSHTSMAELSASALQQELEDTLALLPENCPVHLLRPPGGIDSPQVETVCRDMGLSVISWSVDPMDWNTRNTESIETAVMEQIHDGAVILMHDMYDSSVDAALELIDRLQAQGYRFVTVSQLARLRHCPLEPGQVYRRFPPEEL